MAKKYVVRFGYAPDVLLQDLIGERERQFTSKKEAERFIAESGLHGTYPDIGCVFGPLLGFVFEKRA